MIHYTLDEQGKPIVELDHEKWAEWIKQPGIMVVDSTVIGPSTIKTNFLGMALHGNFPRLWQTKVIGGTLDEVCANCAGSIISARVQHERICRRVRAAVPLDL